MVNQVILDYLRNYSSTYNLEDLKKKIVSAGYSEPEVDEAIQILGLDKQVQTALTSEEKTFPAYQGFKWIKFAGIIGIIFLILGIAGSIASIILPFFYMPSNLDLNSLMNIASFFTNPIFIILSIIIFLLFPILSIFFYFGFTKTGKYAESKLLRFSSFAFVFLTIFFVILSLVSILLLIVFGNSIVESLVSSADFGGLTVSSGENYENVIVGSAVNSLGVQFSSLGTILGIVFLILVLFVLVNILLFFIGLIKIGKKVKYAKIAGILGLIVFLISAGIGLGLIFNPLLIFALLSSGEFGIFFIGSILSSFGCLVLLFMSLALFDASKKFESS